MDAPTPEDPAAVEEAQQRVDAASAELAEAEARLAEARGEGGTGRWTEAEGDTRTFDEIRELVNDAITAKLALPADQYLWVRDITDAWAVYELDSGENAGNYQVDYSIDDQGAVTLGEPKKVEGRTTYTATEARDRIVGRVLEAKGTDSATGGRIFAVQIIAYGDSRNPRRYPESVMRDAAPLYEGAKAFDHHRTEAELASSTINGLVGSYRGVAANREGLQADLHLLPSATHTAEALDASLEAVANGLQPLVGISHDVMARYRTVVEGGRRLQEAAAILAVNSADVVADPAAGGRATRMVAGGNGDEPNDPRGGASMNFKQLMELLRAASAEKRTELLTEHAAVLEAAGYTNDDVPTLLGETAGDGAGGGDGTGGGTPAPVPAGVGAGGEGGDNRGTEAGGRSAAGQTFARDSVFARLIVENAVGGANLDKRLVESVLTELPDTFTEAEAIARVQSVARIAEGLEKQGLLPQHGSTVTVGKESLDKKVERLDAMFDGDYQKGYHSFKQAYVDFMNSRESYGLDGEDFNRRILVESIDPSAVAPYNSSRRGAQRATESADTTTWALALGDSITRRLIKEYALPGLDAWRGIVSSTPPVNDFRTQRRDRIGGYGVLPTVAEGAPYQPLTTPGNEEATYAINKKGGTEDLTLEMIANDDLQLVVQIPKKLGRAAAQTLYRFVFDLLVNNVVCTYDSVALFHASHNNTDAASALSATTLTAARTKLMKQTAYGDSSEVLAIMPRTLIVPADTAELAWQLVTSAVQITSGANATIPNINQDMSRLVVPYFTDTNDWFLVADPAMVPTIEVGFYQGRQEPELFVQNDPTVGSVFDADKITWKIRHIYSGTVLDHRAFYRGQG